MKTCNFPECGRQHRAQGLCSGHIYQLDAGKPLKPLRAFHYKDENGRVCATCKEYKPYSDYYSKVRTNCKDCLIKINTITNRKRRQRQYEARSSKGDN